MCLTPTRMLAWIYLSDICWTWFEADPVRIVCCFAQTVFDSIPPTPSKDTVCDLVANSSIRYNLSAGLGSWLKTLEVWKVLEQESVWKYRSWCEDMSTEQPVSSSNMTRLQFHQNSPLSNNLNCYWTMDSRGAFFFWLIGSHTSKYGVQGVNLFRHPHIILKSGDLLETALESRKQKSNCIQT